ncbi:MAG: hypothetical protein IJV30_01915 [Oscillospiraceae bacterium]|nr:hypothetical protein [Oscillospiraceae bacterium]
MTQIPDHPEIQRAEREGVQEPKHYPICPCCGSECETIYMDEPTGIIHGCDVCVKVKEAWEVSECFPDE